MADIARLQVMPDLTERRARRLLLTTTIIGMFAINVDFFSINLAIPAIAEDLDTTTTTLQWAVSATLLALGACLIPAGRLGDLIGRRPVYLVGLGVFALSSLLSALATDVGFLVAMRALQGVGGAIVMPLSIAILTNSYDDTKQRQRAIGLLYGVGAIGSAIGPFVGGVLTENLGWEWVFLFNVPFGLGALLLGLRSVPDSKDETVPRSIDWAGAVLIASGIVALSYAFDRAPEWGWDSITFLSLATFGIFLLVLFVVLEGRLRYPLVDLALFKIRAYVVVTIAGLFANIGFVIALFASTIYLQQVRGLSPLEAGALFLFPSIAVAFAGPLSARLAERLRPEHVGAIAVIVGGIGLLVQNGSDAWAFFVPGFAIMGLGYGIGWSYASVGTQAVVPQEKAGAASGVTLAIVIAGAGIALVVATAFIRELSDGPTPTSGAIQDVLRAVACLTLAVGGLLLLAARREAARSVGDTTA